MKNLIRLTLIFCLFQISVFSQQITSKKVDSLISIVQDQTAYTRLGDKEMLRLITEAYYQSKEINYDKGILNSLIKFLEIYYNTNNVDGVENKIQEAKEYALKLDDYYNLCRALRYEGWMYTKIGRYSDAKKILYEARLNSVKITDLDNRNRTLMNINNSMASYHEAYTGNSDSMLVYAKKAYEFANRISNRNPMRTKYISNTATVIGSIYMFRKDLKNAKKYITFSEKAYIGAEDKAALIQIYKTLGGIANQEKKYTIAIDYFKKALFLSKKYNQNDDEKNIYPMLAIAYEKLNQYQDAVHVLNRYKALDDSLQTTSKLVVNKTSNHHPLKKNQKKYDYKFLYWTLPFLFVILIILYLFYIIKRKRKIKAIKIDEETIDLIINKTDDPDLEELNQLITFAKVNEQSFYTKFYKLYPEFNSNLLRIHPSLSTSELRLCTYLKVNFDTKQIASATNSTIKSIDAKKYRLRKKINLNTTEEIYTYIAKF